MCDVLNKPRYARVVPGRVEGAGGKRAFKDAIFFFETSVLFKTGELKILARTMLWPNRLRKPKPCPPVWGNY